jgi:hypothetical protein
MHLTHTSWCYISSSAEVARRHISVISTTGCIIIIVLFCILVPWFTLDAMLRPLIVNELNQPYVVGASRYSSISCVMAGWGGRHDHHIRSKLL